MEKITVTIGVNHPVIKTFKYKDEVTKQAATQKAVEFVFENMGANTNPWPMISGLDS